RFPDRTARHHHRRPARRRLPRRRGDAPRDRSALRLPVCAAQAARVLRRLWPVLAVPVIPGAAARYRHLRAPARPAAQLAGVRLPWRLLVGARFNLATGRPYTQLQVDFASQTFSGTRNNQRLPTTIELDLRVDREWIFRRWALALFLEALNVTYSESIYGVTF